MADNITVVFLILAAVVLSGTHIVMLCSYLKRTHHAVWVGLGEPSPWNWSARNSFRMWTFIWRDHAKIDSLQLRAYVISGQVLQVLIIALLFVLAVAYWRTGAS